MAEVSRLKKSRSANRNVLKGFVVKAKNVTGEEYNEKNRVDIEAVLKTIERKRKVVADLDEKILDLLDEDAIEVDVDEASNFELQLDNDVAVIQDYLDKKAKKVAEKLIAEINVPPVTRSPTQVPTAHVRLPKIFIKKFCGDPTTWQQFHETFEATVHKNESLSKVERFTYLKGYLGGAAEKCIEGLNLSNDNYDAALNLLKERYANPQLMIASHMNKLLKVEKVSSGRNCKELRNLYDQVESHVRSLKTVGVNSEHYGPLLIPIILERVPNEIKLEISRKLGTENWKIDEFMGILKAEITARESCDFLQAQFSESRPSENEGRHFTTEALFSVSKSLVCAFCGENHYHDQCNVVTELKERQRIVWEKRLCYKCLFRGHDSRKCRIKRNCFKCRSWIHHTAICDKEYRKKTDLRNDESKDKSRYQDNPLTSLVSSRTSVLLQTASAIILDNAEKRSHRIRILLDSGSQKTYLSQRIVDRLQLSSSSSREMSVKTFGNPDGMSGVYYEYKFCLRNTKRGGNLYMSGMAVPYICSPLSGQRVNVVEELFPSLKDLDLSDVTESDGDIDLLIGADYYWTIVEGGVIRCGNDGLTAINTKLGWVLSGPYESQDRVSSTALVTHVMTITEEVELDVKDGVSDRTIERLWDLETLGIKEDELSVYDKFLEKVQFKEGRYEVSLPFKESRPFIEDNYLLSEKRLQSLKKKLEKDEKLLEQYNDVIKKQIDAGIVEKVDTEPTVGEVTYLPHRAVIREDKKTTKVRIVFDGSARNKGPSLNECLFKGPLLTPMLFDVLLRFRVSNIGLTADIEKAYLQISVTPSERDYLRFLWYDDVTKKNPEVIKYRFTRVIFGATCSQFLLNGVIKIHAEKYAEIDAGFPPKVLRHFYIDDLSCSMKSYDESVELYKKLKLRFLEGQFNLRKWRTSDEHLRKFISSQEGTVDDVADADKVLGIRWDEYRDVFLMDVKSSVEKATDIEPTKRNVLKIIAGIYDPLGFLQPFIVDLKILFQKICVACTGWDDTLNDDLQAQWRDVISSIQNVGELVIPRNYCPNFVDDSIVNVELHGFSDASEVAYGACIYLKFVMSSGSSQVSLVTAKSRIVPLTKKQTVPRLELLGNLILSNLVRNVIRALEMELPINKVFCWTDSTISLAWIKAVNKEFKTFVQNRVSSIRSNVNADQWYYCRSEVNPADIITRGGGDVKSEIWWNGPDFLHYPVVNMDASKLQSHVIEPPELKQELVSDNFTLLVKDNSKMSPMVIGNVIDIQKYNDYLKLMRVTGYVIRFINNIKSKLIKKPLVTSKFLTCEEINEARRQWVIDNQIDLDDDEKFSDLKRNLNLSKDGAGVMRSYSRLKNANIPFDTKAPVFINRNHKLAELIVYYCHNKVLHRGVKQTLTEVRSSFWIARGRNFVKKLLYPCAVCRRLNARPYEYPTHSDLPEFRFDDNHPFSSTGVDYLGPLFCLPVYGESDKLYKAFVVIYTCAASRAVILEVVNSANADTFINCFKRFISRRGCPTTMISDNGTVFCAETTQKFASNRHIKWKFNLESAPWFGGMWERLVGSVKKCIKKVVGTKRITYIELQTLINEIELILNNRPIGVDYDDDQEDVLTPNHLIFGRRLESSNGDVIDTESSCSVNNKKLVNRKRFIDTMLNHFWNIWRREYLTSLRGNQRIAKKKGSTQISLDDVVLIYDDEQPRHLWRMGRVETLIAGKDGCIRGAQVKVGKTGTLINRPVNKLYPLVTDTRRDDVGVSPPSTPVEGPIDGEGQIPGSDKVQRPKRNAAIVGEIKRRYVNQSG